MADKRENPRPGHSRVHISYKKASELSSQEHSCVSEMTVERRVSLPPRYINCIPQGLKETVGQTLNQYDKSLDGLPIAFDHVKVLETESRIVDDQAPLLLRLRMSFYVFKPVVGQHLYGRVNIIGEHHVGCLVHKCFNARLYKKRPDELRAGQNDALDNVKVGDRILFQIKKLKVYREVLTITGFVPAENSQGLTNHLSIEQENTTEIKQDIGVSDQKDKVSSPVKKKKKKRKLEHEIKTEPMDTFSNNKSEPMQDNLSPVKKKKVKMNS